MLGIADSSGDLTVLVNSCDSSELEEVMYALTVAVSGLASGPKEFKLGATESTSPSGMACIGVIWQK